MSNRGYINKLRAKTGVRQGTLGPPLERNEGPFIDWLMEQLPHGSTLSEILVAIAVDVYNEQQELETYKSLFRRLVRPLQFTPELNQAELDLLKEIL